MKKLERILLVHPMDPTLSEQTPFAPFPLLCLAGAVEDLAEIQIVDATNKDVTWVMQQVAAFEPQWVGISALYTFFLPGVLAVSRAIKEQYGDEIQIVSGGHGVTFISDEVLSTGVIDAVVRGEGEATFREMVQKRAFEGVQGVSYVDDGRVVHNPTRPLIQNLDDLPLPAYHLVDMGSVDYFQLETSRGCPYRCAFCDTSRFYGHTWRAKSVERTIKELKLLDEKYGEPAITLLTDDNINTDMPRLDRICQRLIEEGLRVPFQIQMRTDDIARNPQSVRLMAEVGTQIIVIGLESGSQETLKKIRKGTKLHHVVRTGELLKEHGIHLLGSYMIGMPHETVAMAEETTRLGIETTDTVAVNLFTPYPGTEMYDQCKREGLLLTEDWGQYDQHHQIVKTVEWPEVDFAQVRDDMCRLFYNRADWIKSHFVPQPGISGGLAVFTRNFYSAWASYYLLDSFEGWAEVLEGYRFVANEELGHLLGDYDARLRWLTDSLTLDLVIRGGQLAPPEEPVGPVDVTVRTSDRVLNDILRLMNQDTLSALIEGKIVVETPWPDLAAFVRWCDAYQETVDVRVIKRAPDAPTCLPALNEQIAHWSEPKPEWLVKGGRYLLKTEDGDLVLGVRGQRISDFRFHAGGRLRRIRQKIALDAGVTQALRGGDFQPLWEALDDGTT